MCQPKKYSHGEVKWKQAIFSVDNFIFLHNEHENWKKRKRESGRDYNDDYNKRREEREREKNALK